MNHNCTEDMIYYAVIIPSFHIYQSIGSGKICDLAHKKNIILRRDYYWLKMYKEGVYTSFLYMTHLETFSLCSHLLCENANPPLQREEGRVRVSVHSDVLLNLLPKR